RVLEAVEHLDAVCRQQGITRAQALAAFDPVRTRWFPFDTNALVLLPPSAKTARVPDDQVRAVLLRSLSRDDLVGLCGGMDASAHLVPAETLAGLSSVAEGHLVSEFGVRRATGPDRFTAVAEPAYVEFRMDPTTASELNRNEARALVVPGKVGDDPIEIWWSNGTEAWSELRSLRWRGRQERGVGASSDWALPLECLPEGNLREAHRLRIIFRTAGQSVVGAPRLLR
ncbi:MAG TPA: hypothetical protein VGZ22_15530, partial [Isosphaeraceae bacterium]|nr:hypothetical protein [Isosphaeraceae bacterium]